MSFFPVGFDPRSDAVGILDLALINTPDGDFGYILGQDGKFTDVNDFVWWGCTLVTQADMEFPINGTAPSGSLTLSYFQDPSQPDLIAQIRSLGAAYVQGRPITFYQQIFGAISDLWQPVVAPIRVMTRRMTGISYGGSGDLERSITLTFESAYAGRNTGRGLSYNTEDHARLIGAANPSLQYMPHDTYQEEPLFA